MRLAVSGKGGVGKTTIAGTLCRLIGRSGRPVLALDADSNPNLAVSLGLPHQPSEQITAVPTDLAEWRTYDDGKAYVHLTMPFAQVEQEYGVAVADNVTLLLMGQVNHAGVGCRCSAHASARGLMDHLWQADAPVIVTDMEAGLEHLGRGTTEHADALLIVVEPYYRALEAGRRIRELATELGIPRIYAIANKIRSEADATAVSTFCQQHNMPLIATIPFDEQILTAEANGIGMIDANPEGAFVTAVATLMKQLDKTMKNGQMN